MKKRSASITMKIISICFFVLSFIMLCIGCDKKNTYKNSEYSSLNKNAYVGGDAYNFIINGTYSTGYYVLSMGFLMSGVILASSGAIINSLNKNEKDDEIPSL